MLVLLVSAGVFLADMYVFREVVLPGPPYFISILIAAYFLSPRTTAGVAAFATVLKLIADLTGQAPFWLLSLYFSALVLVGFVSTALASKMKQEAALAAEMEELRADAERRSAELEFERGRWQAPRVCQSSSTACLHCPKLPVQRCAVSLSI